MDQNRRTFIKQLSVMAATGAYLKLCGLPAFAGMENAPDGLAAIARAHGREFGCSVLPDLLKKKAFTDTLKRDCTILVAENHMKWSHLNPEPNVYNFSGADAILNFAKENNMIMRFHTLIWYKGLPEWLEQEASGKTKAEKILRNYTDKVLTRYRGKMHSWDIVNEPVNPFNPHDDGLRRSLWYKTLGSDYVAQCFQIAREYDLGGPLVLNEFGLETADILSSRKRRQLLDLVRNLKDRDVPVDAVGLQSHLNATKELADAEEYQIWLQALTDTGVKIFITEMDVNDCDLPGNDTERAVLGAAYAAEYLRRVHEVTVPEEIVLWGIWDGHSVINWKRPHDKRVCQPLPYAKDWKKNPLWDSCRTALEY